MNAHMHQLLHTVNLDQINFAGSVIESASLYKEEDGVNHLYNYTNMNYNKLLRHLSWDPGYGVNADKAMSIIQSAEWRYPEERNILLLKIKLQGGVFIHLRKN